MTIVTVVSIFSGAVAVRRIPSQPAPLDAAPWTTLAIRGKASPFPLPNGECAKFREAVRPPFSKGVEHWGAVRRRRGKAPYLKVFSAHLHMDEATPHLHVDFVPFTTESKRGLDARVSLKQALANQGFVGGTRGDTEWSQWVKSEKEQLSQVMERHGIEWEQLGTHDEHLSVMDYKKVQRSKEVVALEKTIAKLQNKQVDVQAVEQITVKNVPLSSKVMLEKKDYDSLVTAAQKYVVQVKKERKLEKLLQAAEKTIAGLKTKIA